MAINFNDYAITETEMKTVTKKRVNRASKYDALLRDFMSSGLASVSIPIEDILEGEKPALQSVLVGLRNAATKNCEENFNCSKDYVHEDCIVLMNMGLVGGEE